MESDAVLDAENKAFQDLMAAAEAVPADQRQTIEVVPGWTPHDVLWHVAYWIERAGGVLELARVGPPFPEEPEEGEYYDQQNDLAMPQGREMTWEQITDYLVAGRERACAAMRGRSPEVAAWMDERLGEEIDHFQIHTEDLRRAVS